MKKLIVSSVSVVAVIGVIGVGAFFANDKTTGDVKTTGSYIINVSDKRENVGYVDNVSVGRVDEIIGTEYRNYSPVGESKKDVGTPYTRYGITVVDNIKGELPTDRQIEILKDGGIKEDGTGYWTYENDELLEVGKYYIILSVNGESDLRVSGPYSNTELNVEVNSTEEDLILIKESDLYKEYVESYNNEKVYDRERREPVLDK